MKLLLDENLSPKLPPLIANQFPDSAHVRDCNLKGKSDKEVWDYAGSHGFTIVSKDGDFYHRAVLFGPPPKLVWLRIGNCTRAALLDLLLAHEKDIRDFESASEAVLLLS